MWPWQRTVEIVLASSAVDATTAALTMILRYHHRPVSVDEVRQAIDEGRTAVPNAGDLVRAADRFRVCGYGLGLENPVQLATIPKPNIAHMMWNRAPFPRSLGPDINGHFVVLVSTSPHRVRWIDPYRGKVEGKPAEFLDFASGVFLIFHEALALPRAQLMSGRSEA